MSEKGLTFFNIWQHDVHTCRVFLPFRLRRLDIGFPFFEDIWGNVL